MRRIHRGFAWFAAAVLLVWASSGLLHVVMTWTQPRAAQFAPPQHDAMQAEAMALDDVLAAAGIDRLREARLLRFDGETLLRVRAPGTPEARYVRMDGRLAPADTDRRRALVLAAHYLDAPVRGRAQPVADFGNGYDRNSRLLPVWRVTPEGGPEAFVDTAFDRLAALLDARKYALLGGFRALHTLAPLQRWPRLRLAVVGLLHTAATLAAVLGAVMLWRSGGRTPSRRRHRRLALVALVPLLVYLPTGLLHLAGKALAPSVAAPPQAVSVAGLALPGGAFDELLLVPAGKHTVWRAMAGGTVRHFQPDGTPASSEDADLARAIAALHGFAGARPVDAQQRFDDDYDFLNRRLPVWRLQDDRQLLFVDHRSGWLVATMTPLSRLESRTFSGLHKWGVLDPAGRAVRDGAMVLAALLLVALACSGLLLRR